jgi:hypothetical protein
MTMAACYYECTDGKWYADPVWRGEEFTVHMDEDGEFIWIKLGSKLKPGEILRELGIKAEKIELDHRSTRYINKKFQKSTTYSFRLYDIIPQPHSPKIGVDSKQDKKVTQYKDIKLWCSVRGT